MSTRLASCALGSLTRRVGVLNLSRQEVTKSQSFMTVASSIGISSSIRGPLSSSLLTTTPVFLPSLSVVSFADSNGGSRLTSLNGPFFQPNRTMVTRKKRLARRERRRLAAKATAKQTGEEVAEGGEEKAAPQHAAWVDFQKSISVGDFQTGQTTKVRVQQKGESGQKLRDLKRREKMEMRMATKRPEISDVRGGEYPVGRYSDEETERLLAMAYAAIPDRPGKRGTRNLKRQKNRWFLVRKIRAKAKHQKTMAHFRRMDKRSVRIKETFAVKAAAPSARVADRNYQREILQRWVQNLKNGDDDVIQADESSVGQEAKA